MALDLYTVRLVLGRMDGTAKIPSSIGGSLTVQYGDQEKTVEKNQVDYEDWTDKVITWGEDAYINLPAGAEITLIATPSAGFFVHGFYWSSTTAWDVTQSVSARDLTGLFSGTLDATGATSYTFTPSGNRTLFCIFDWDIKNSPIFIESSPSSAGTATMKDALNAIMIQYPADDTYESYIEMGSAYIGGTPDTVSLEAVANTGFTFSHWERRENIMARFGIENVQASYQDDPSFDVISWGSNDNKITKFAWSATAEAIIPEAHIPDSANFFYGDHASFFSFVAVFVDDSVVIEDIPDYTRELLDPVKLFVGVRGSGKITGADKFGFSYNDKTSNTTMFFEKGEYAVLFADAGVGYVFSHFEGAINGGSSPAYILMDANKAITVVFIAAPRLTVSVSGSGTVLATDGDINCPGTCTDVYQVKDAVDILTATPSAGYYFKEWTGDIESREEEITVTMSDDLTLEAVFMSNPVTTITIDGSGTVVCSLYDSGTETWTPYLTVSAASGSASVPIGSNVKLEATGSFVKWIGDVSGYVSPFYPVFVNGDKAITAVFGTRYSVGITVSPPDSGYVLGEDIDTRGGQTSFSVLSGETLHLFAVTTKKGIYRFLNWSGGTFTGAVNPKSTSIIGNISIVANFEIVQYRITMAGEGAIEVTDGTTIANYPTDGYADFDVETEITLTATAPEEKSFWYWGGDIEGAENPVSVRVTSDMRITPFFYDENELGWLEKRMPKYLSESQRWVDFVTAIEKFWVERFDPFLKYLKNHRSIFSASLEARERIVKELGKYFEASLPPEKLPVAIQRRKVNLLQKGEIAPVLEMLGKIDPTTTVEWVPFYAPRSLPYGTVYYTETELPGEGLTDADVLFTSKGRLSLNGFRLPFMSRDDWSALFRTLKPLHIGFDVYPGFEDGSVDIGSGFDGCSVDTAESLTETPSVEILENKKFRTNFIDIGEKTSIDFFFIDNNLPAHALYIYARIKYDSDHFTLGGVSLTGGILSIDAGWAVSTSETTPGEVVVTISYNGATPTHSDFAMDQTWTTYAVPFQDDGTTSYTGWGGSWSERAYIESTKPAANWNTIRNYLVGGVLFKITLDKRTDLTMKTAISETYLLDYGYFYEAQNYARSGLPYNYIGFEHRISQTTGKEYIDRDIRKMVVNVSRYKAVAGSVYNILESGDFADTSTMVDAPKNEPVLFPSFIKLSGGWKDAGSVFSRYTVDTKNFIQDFYVDSDYPYWLYLSLEDFGIFPSMDLLEYPVKIEKKGLITDKNYSLESEDGVTFTYKVSYRMNPPHIVKDLTYTNGAFGRIQDGKNVSMKDVPSLFSKMLLSEKYFWAEFPEADSGVSDRDRQIGLALSSLNFVIGSSQKLDETLDTPQIPYDEFAENGTKLLFFTVPATSTVTLNLKQNYSGMALYVNWDGALPSTASYDAAQAAATDPAITQAAVPEGTYYALLVLKNKNEGFAYNGWRIELTFA